MLIFVIDDEESVLKETVSVIEKAAPDAEIMTFNRALQALEAIRSGKRPDIVFSDIEIPGISGLDFALQTKELSPSTRIVFITGYRDYAVEAFKIKDGAISRLYAHFPAMKGTSSGWEGYDYAR